MNQMMFDEISRQLGILKEPFEDSIAWQNRIKHSVLGLQLLSALYDKYDDFEDDALADNSVSRQHITSRAKKLADIFAIEQDDCDAIIELYTKMGFMLEKRNRLVYPPVSTAQVGQNVIVRGVHPSSAVVVSGLGFLIESNSVTLSNIDEMFNLATIEIMQWHESFMELLTEQWVDAKELLDVQFFNPTAKPWESWSDNSPKSGLILCRNTELAGRRYRIVSADRHRCVVLPFIGRGEYRRLEISLRILADNPPKAKITKYKRTSIFDCDFWLPPMEQSFVELYSWKRGNSQDSNRWLQSRIVANELHDVFIRIFRRMGYEIEEV